MVVYHVIDMAFNVAPLLERLPVSTILVETVSTLKLEPDSLVIVHIHVVATFTHEDVHRLETTLEVASFEHLHRRDSIDCSVSSIEQSCIFMQSAASLTITSHGVDLSFQRVKLKQGWCVRDRSVNVL